MCQCTQNTVQSNSTQAVVGGLIDWSKVGQQVSTPVAADPIQSNATMPAAEMWKALVTYRTPKERFLSTLQLIATVLTIIIAIRVLFINKN